MLNETKIKKLLERITAPGKVIPQGVSDTALAAFSQRIGITLPLEVIDLLKITNAPYIGGQILLGISDEEHRDIESCYLVFPEWKEQGWLPIGDDVCGNYYVIPTREEFGKGYPVLFIEAVIDANIPAYIVASDVGHFVEFIIERELGVSQWPFSKDQVLAKDPDILIYHGVPLPWEAP